MDRLKRTARGLAAWTWRGFLTRVALVTSLIPGPPHRRNPRVSERLQVAPFEMQPGPPPVGGEGGGVASDQDRPTPYPPHLEHQRPKP